jgi:hypothetical protein
MKEPREITLLRACYDMLRQCNESGYVVSPMELTTHYDGADCDGACLMDDIRDCLEEFEE